MLDCCLISIAINKLKSTEVSSQFLPHYGNGLNDLRVVSSFEY